MFFSIRPIHNGREGSSMSKLDESRRAFLVGAAVGAGAVAGLVPDALAQTQEQHGAADAAATAGAHDHGGGGHGTFLNDDDAATVEAFAERIMPGAAGKPGARDAGVRNYIDLALAGAYADLQDFYRRGLSALDAHCRATYKEPFVKLDAERQDAVITALEQGKAPAFTDPVYGGNKDFAGWMLVGFPGAQPLFSPPDLQSKDAFTGAPVLGLQSQAKTPLRRL
jgi:gluconate 2-dehydrogenase gamma chain